MRAYYHVLDALMLKGDEALSEEMLRSVQRRAKTTVSEWEVRVGAMCGGRAHRRQRPSRAVCPRVCPFAPAGHVAEDHCGHEQHLPAPRPGF